MELYENFTLSREYIVDNYNTTGVDNFTVDMHDHEESTFEVVVKNLNKLGIPILVLVGIIGNTLSLLVFVTSHLKVQSSSVYLAVLNVVDTGFLLSLFVVWFGFVNIHPINLQGFCQLVIYFTYVCSFLSVWTVVGFTCERFIVVFMPLHRHRFCTRKRAAIVMACLIGFAAIAYSFSFWTSGIIYIDAQSTHGYCQPFPQYYQLLHVLTSIDTLLTLILPSLTIIVLNTGIAIKIFSFLHRSSESPEESSLSVETSLYPGPNGVRACALHNGVQHTTSARTVKQTSQSQAGSFRNRAMVLRCHSMQACMRRNFQIRTTRALLIVSSVFLVLNFPSHIFRIHAFFVYLQKTRFIYPKTALLWQHLCQLLYYSNFAVNVFLYSSCSRSFRRALRRMCSRFKHMVMEPVYTLPYK